MRNAVHLIGMGIALVAGAAASAELYKWVDERGITNYSNEPQPAGRGAKKVEVEDRFSVYTPDEAIRKALENDRVRRSAPTAPPAPAVAAPSAVPPRPTLAPPAVTAPAAPPVAAIQPVQPSVSVTVAPYDPCISGANPNCYAPSVYDQSPVFVGRQRAPVLNQPQLPPGAIAGNVTGMSGITPGLSGLTPAPAPPSQPAARPRPSNAPPPAARDRMTHY